MSLIRVCRILAIVENSNRRTSRKRFQPSVRLCSSPDFPAVYETYLSRVNILIGDDVVFVPPDFVGRSYLRIPPTVLVHAGIAYEQARYATSLTFSLTVLRMPIMIHPRTAEAILYSVHKTVLQTDGWRHGGKDEITCRTFANVRALIFRLRTATFSTCERALCFPLYSTPHPTNSPVQLDLAALA
jgi:hypothetical protein